MTTPIPEALAHDDSVDLVEIGVVTRAHGIRGALKVRLHNPSSTALAEIPSDRWCLRDASGICRRGLRLDGRQGEMLFMKAEGISGRDAAEALRGAVLCVRWADLAVDEDEYLYADLIGCRVVEGERDFGHVVDLFSAGASDVLVVRDDAGHERLIPLVDAWVANVDVASRRVELSDGDAWDDLDVTSSR
ncbi:MAG: 16S rRNA processing protein RimM [Deltaproteobacteria bacterium]|nr:16S rRNA processing protein RimM [Deltaproteobacteria bacterium]